MHMLWGFLDQLVTLPVTDFSKVGLMKPGAETGKKNTQT